MKKPWRVRFHNSNKDYEEILDFDTEAKARKLYDRVKKHQFLAYSMIFNRLEGAANELLALAEEMAKGKVKDRKKLSVAFRKAALAICTEISK